MFKFRQLSSDLYRQLSGWCQHYRLDFAGPQKIVFSEVLDSGQPKRNGLTRTSQISSNEIFPIINRVEAVLLNWEQIHVAFALHNLH